MMSKRPPGARRRYDESASQRGNAFQPPHDRSISNTLMWRCASAITSSCARIKSSSDSRRASRGSPGGGGSDESGRREEAMSIPFVEDVLGFTGKGAALVRREHAAIGQRAQQPHVAL